MHFNFEFYAVQSLFKTALILKNPECPQLKVIYCKQYLKSVCFAVNRFSVQSFTPLSL